MIDCINWQDHLKKSGPEWESRWDNCQELITFAVDVDTRHQETLSELAAQWVDTAEEFYGPDSNSSVAGYTAAREEQE